MARWYQLSGAKWLRTNVQTQAGSDGEEEPRSLDVGAQRMDVLEIVERWSTSEHHHFKVKVRNRQIYVLRRGKTGEVWEYAPAGTKR